jgi:phosphoserine aminotransferase
MQTERVHNFNPGPAALPLPVLERVRDELLNFQRTGMSILETSHRSPEYRRVHEGAIEALRRLLEIPNDYAVLLMGGGATLQFALVAMNLLQPGQHADYLITGRWSEKALKEAQLVGDARAIWSSQATNYDRVPRPDEFTVSPDAAYLHYTSNNTVAGTQFHYVPETGGVPLVCDMSSDIASRPLDVSRFGIIYAGAQKNLGPAGVTVVIIHLELLERSRARNLPSLLNYAKIAEKNSLLNTPPVFAVYILGLVTQHYLEQGGLKALAELNEQKARMLYETIDNSEGFYRGCARPESRSLMNVTFRLPSEALEVQFIEEAGCEGLVGLKGHRSVGGLRASLYNAVSLEAVQALIEFMKEFQRRHG